MTYLRFRIPVLYTIALILSLGSALGAEELVLYSYDGTMDSSHGGFLRVKRSRDFLYLDVDRILKADLTHPIDYANGELHVYMQIKNQPVPQEMLVCLNIFQPDNDSSERREIGTRRELISGEAGNTYKWIYQMGEYGGWSTDIRSFWYAWGRSDLVIDWSEPREPYLVRFWNTSSEEVHNFNGNNWGGENPAEWFPIEMVYVAVLVESGQEFSGWENYIDATGQPVFAEEQIAREEIALQFFLGAQQRNNIYYSLDWFGLFDARNFPEIHHQKLGSLYCAGEGGDSLWMYSPLQSVGWIWTTPAVYPYMYFLEAKSWAYFHDSFFASSRWFYLYKTNEWINRGQP